MGGDQTRPGPAGTRRLTDSGVVRRVLVAAATGGFAFAVSAFFQDVSIEAVVLSVLTAGIVFLVQLLVDFEARLESVESQHRRAQVRLEAAVEGGFAALTETVEERFAQSTEAGRLLNAVGASAVDKAVVAGLLEDAARLGPHVAPLLKRLADAEIDRASRFVRQLVHGEVVYEDGEDHDWLLALTRQTTSSLDATSTTVVDGMGATFRGGLWTSDFGERYLKAQEDAVKRGVTVRRLFIMRDYAEFTAPDFLPIAHAQRTAGIHVRALQHDQVPVTLRPTLIDFIVFDEAVRYEVIPTPSAQGGFLKTHLTTDPGRVAEQRHRFERLWALADQQDRDRRAADGDEAGNGEAGA